jgi:Flp pilus assembly protein TadD
MLIQSKLSGFLLALTIATATPELATADCIAPPALEARLRSDHSVQAYTELGTWFGDRKKFVCAADAYGSALQLEPHSPKLHYLLGLSLYSSGFLKEAIAPLQQSIEIAPDVLKPHFVLAAVLEGLQRQPEANAEWQAALKIDPDSKVALHGLARSLIAGGNSGDAISLLIRTRLNEDLTVDLAQAYIHSKMLDDAAKLLAGAVNKNPSSARLANILTTVLVKQFRYQDAEKLAAKAAAQHPSDLETQKLYLQTLIFTGNSAVSAPLARKLLAQKPHDFDFLYINGLLEQDLAEYEISRQHLQEALAVNPNASAAHYSLGLVLKNLNDPKGAKEHFQKALELGSTEAEVHLELAKILRVLGESQRSAEELNLYQEGLKKRNGMSVAASKAAQGDKELASGDPKRAVSFYRESLDATPDDAQLNFKLAVALDRVGDLAGERVALEKAIQIKPDLAVAHNQLGFLASQSGDSASAEKHFREAVRSAPRFTEAWVNLAATLGLESRFSEAEQAVASALQLEPSNPQALQLRQTLARAREQR